MIDVWDNQTVIVCWLKFPVYNFVSFFTSIYGDYIQVIIKNDVYPHRSAENDV